MSKTKAKLLEGLWSKLFVNSGGKTGNLIHAWNFSGRSPHAKQFLKVGLNASGQKVSTITTCYAGATEKIHPFVRETTTQLGNGLRRTNICGVNGAGKTFFHTGNPADPQFRRLLQSYYGGGQGSSVVSAIRG